MAAKPVILRDDDNAILELEKDRSILRLIWKGFAHGSVYREVLEQCLTLINEHRLKFFLADSRQMGPILYEDEQWTIKEVSPRYQETGLKRLAILPSRDFFNRMSVERMVDNSSPTAPYQIAYFRELTDAEAWLFGKERAIA